MSDALTYTRNFESKVVSDSADDIFTLASGVLRNLTILVANTSASTVTLQGWLIPDGGSAATGNKFIPTETIAANTAAEYKVPKMVAGDKLTLQAGTASVLSVFEFDGVSRA